MNGAISLSKRERRYQFFYLLGMLLVVLLVSGFVFLRKFQSPFTQTDVMDIQLLAQKNKFSEQQKIVEPLLKNTFTKISILKVESHNLLWRTTSKVVSTIWRTTFRAMRCSILVKTTIFKLLNSIVCTLKIRK